MTHKPASPRTRLRPIFVATALAFGTVAFAQDTASIRITDVEVTAILPATLEAIPGSTHVVTGEDIERVQPPSVKEALKLTPGVHIVDEDPLGLNLNLGIRGLNPRRAQRVHVLEDGMPIAFAPYGDPETHYTPSIERVERIEILKGSGQIIHGPQTLGGVVNFIGRPLPTDGSEARLRLAGGNQGYGSVYARYGAGSLDRAFAIDFVHKRADGNRDKFETQVNDLALSGRIRIDDRQSLTLRGSYMRERSDTTEAGITQAQFDTNPFLNPFDHDRFEFDRWGGQLIHEFDLSEDLTLTTRVYRQKISRVSYRQIDESDDSMIQGNRRGIPAGTTPGCVHDDYSTAASCGNKMRPRDFSFWGVEPRIDWHFDGFGMQNHMVAGVRYHTEDVTRRRYNGLSPNAREDSPGSIVREWNEIETDAYSAFLQNTFLFDRWTVTPGVRVERFESSNLTVIRRGLQVEPLAGGTDQREVGFPDGSSVTNRKTEVLPGLGATYQLAPTTTAFAGVHQGIAPPRPDSNLSPGDPAWVPVDAEKSTSYELGVRSTPVAGLAIEAALFRIDFDNQIVPGSAVGLPLQTFANAGESLNQGLEIGWRAQIGDLIGAPGNGLYLLGAYTWLFDAKFDSDQISGGQNIKGNRLPYAPEHLLNASVGYEFPWGVDLRFGVEYVSRQFTDSVNSEQGAANGRTGAIPSYTLYNMTVNYETRRDGLSLFLMGNNLADKKYFANRTDGIQIGRTRQIIGGIDWQF